MKGQLELALLQVDEIVHGHDNESDNSDDVPHAAGEKDLKKGLPERQQVQRNAVLHAAGAKILDHYAVVTEIYDDMTEDPLKAAENQRVQWRIQWRRGLCGFSVPIFHPEAP